MTKIRLLLFAFLFAYIAIVVRLFYLQILNPITSGDYLRTSKITPQRGRIFDRNMQPLVTNQLKYQMFLEPKKMEDEEVLKVRLAKELGVEEASIAAKIDKTKDWVALYGGITQEIKDRIDALKLAGIGFDESEGRYYPEGSTSAHILGFVGKDDEGGNVGYFGIEGFYDRDLAGLPGLIRSDLDLVGRPIFMGTQQKIEPENGRDLVLSVDRSVQDIVKRKLAEGMEKYEAKEGCVIVADPTTLSILGLACLPDFNPDSYYEFDGSSYKNQAISSLYEPGSTFKPLIMAAGIQEGVIRPDTVFDESGQIGVGEYNIKTWNDSYEGKITMTRVLEKSSNVGMVYVGEKLGNKRLVEYIKKYGFGDLTGIDLQGEVPGYLKPLNEWYPIDYATATFGQGLAVSPIQMVRAFSSIINGGNLMVPHMVHKLIGPSSEQKIEPVVTRRIIDEKVSKQVKQMLLSTIENGETKFLKPTGYSIGGKTGTAQIAIKGHYDATKTIASFIGFSPIENPRFVALVVLKEPGSSQWGSETAAPLFFEIAKELIVYYNIAPEQ